MDLDDAYANHTHIPGADDYPPRWDEAARSFRQRLGAVNRARLAIPYGPKTRNELDLFLPLGKPEGLLIFVHGGYWRRFGRGDWSHFSDGALLSHWAVAMPSYTLCPEATIPEITDEVREAVIRASEELPDMPIRLAGHSAGGHLVARMLEPGRLPDAVVARIEAVMPISPVADLEPLLRTSINDDLRLDQDTARAESPIHQPKPKRPVTVWVGADERPAFLDQARWLAEAWDAQLEIEDGRHHFDVIDGLTDPESAMMRRLLG